MVLALAFLPAAFNWLLGAIGALSASIMLMATATNPHFPYEYDNPVRDFALQQFMRGDFATNRDAFFGGGMIVARLGRVQPRQTCRTAGPVPAMAAGASLDLRRI